MVKRKLTSILLAVAMLFTYMPNASYAVESKPEPVTPVVIAKAIPSGSKAVKLSWNKVDTATKYVVYGNKCGKLIKVKKLATVKANKYTVKKIGKTKLAAHNFYKFKVVAYKGTRKLATSKTIHFITAKTFGKYANASKITATIPELTLEVGQSTKVGATVKVYKNKLHIPSNHGLKLRYFSDNSAVATVNYKGEVKAISEGTAKIYIQDIGGLCCTTKVTVKKAVEPTQAQAPTPTPTPIPTPTRTMPVKGDIIKINGKGYRVLSIDDTKAFLVSMYDVAGSGMPFDADGTTSEKDLLQYKDSDIDDYLENTWYAGLDSTMKGAIEATTIAQPAYDYTSTEPGSGTYYAETYDFSPPDYHYIVPDSDKTATVGSRHAYLLDVKDVVDYLGEENLTQEKLNEMFFETASSTFENYCLLSAGLIFGKCWLRSAYAGNDYCAWNVDGNLLLMGFDNYNYAIEARAAFTIDLSQVDFDIVRTTVRIADVSGGAVYDASSYGNKVTSIRVEIGAAVTTNGNEITIGGTDYYASADSKYIFKTFGASLPSTITAATTITPVFKRIIQKGDLITLGSDTTHKYRVLSADGNKAFVMSMYDVSSGDAGMAYDADGGEQSEKDCLQYKDSDIDNYLENTWYEGLDSTMKDAIEATTIDQPAYRRTITQPDSGTYYSGKYRFGTSVTYYIIPNSEKTATVGSRHAYLLDVKDVLDYLGEGNLTPAKVNEMFFDTDSSTSKCCWLRSAFPYYPSFVNGAWLVDGDNGELHFTNNIDYAIEARAAFTIDLSDIDWDFVN